MFNFNCDSNLWDLAVVVTGSCTDLERNVCQTYHCAEDGK